MNKEEVMEIIVNCKIRLSQIEDDIRTLDSRKKDLEIQLKRWNDRLHKLGATDE